MQLAKSEFQNTGRQLMRTPEELEPLIVEQIEIGDEAAQEAGMPYYRKAGAMLEEAKPQFKGARGETFKQYCERVTGRSMSVCQLYVRAFREQQAAIENKKPKASGARLSSSLSELAGSRKNGRVYREWTAPVDEVAGRARREQAKRTDDRATEQKRKQELASRLIDIGFKVLAKELHPDKMGGSKDAMMRLNEVRNRLKQVYG